MPSSTSGEAASHQQNKHDEELVDVKLVSPPIASPDPDGTCCIGDGGDKLNDSTLDMSCASASGAAANANLHTSMNPIVCRICYSTCGSLYSFCKCKGSVGYVHRECLKRWIDAKLKANRCEICQAPFSGTDWSFKPIHKWNTPKMGVLDKLYVALFVCCSIIVLYSIPWISYKAWRSREVIFGEGPVTSERIFALIVIAIYVPLNISCIASLVVLWRRAVSGVCVRFFDTNKTWRVRVSSDVAKTKLINSIDSTFKSPPPVLAKKAAQPNQDVRILAEGMTPIKLECSPRKPDVRRSAKNFSEPENSEVSGDSTTMLIANRTTASSITLNSPQANETVEV